VAEWEKECEGVAEVGRTPSGSRTSNDHEGEKLISADQNEQIVKNYFKDRGWQVTKLDWPGHPASVKAADWRIYNDDYCFLCEVKTVSSVLADVSYGPVEGYMVDKRNKERARLEELKRARPDIRLLVSPDHYEFVYGNEQRFRRQYRFRKRHTESEFKKLFGEKIKRRLSKSSIRNLPYILRFDSDNLYVPTKAELETCAKWVEAELLRIHRGKPSRSWRVSRTAPRSSALYSTFYLLHKSVSDADVDRTIQITAIGPKRDKHLEVEVHCYGMPNLDAITRNVEEASRQLQSSASKEKNESVPRAVVVAFETGITAQMALEWQEVVEPHFAWLLKEYPNSSALAMLEIVLDGTPPPEKEGFLAWLNFALRAPRVPRFRVYHNPCLQGVEPIDPQVFSDNRSVQFRLINGTWQRR